MTFSVLFFDCDPMDIVVCAEGYNLLVGSNVVYYAAADTVDVKVI